MALETIANLNDSTIEKLKDLIKVNIDSQKGFEQACESIENKEIGALFARMAEERKTLAQQLRMHVELNDEEASDSGSISGTVHRWWLSARGTVSGGDDYQVLAEAERGEDAIKERYEDVLKEIPGSALNDLLLDQYSMIKKGHDHIRDLRNAAKN